jgi:hypothetical protein
VVAVVARDRKLLDLRILEQILEPPDDVLLREQDRVERGKPVGLGVVVVQEVGDEVAA